MEDSVIDPRSMLQEILEQAVRLTDASSASLCLVDDDAQSLTIEVAVGLDDAARVDCRLPLGSGITGWVARTGETLVVPDVSRDPRYVALKPSVRSELAVPLRTEGRILGVINVDSERLDAFPPSTVELLEMLARRCVDAIAYAKLYEEVRGQHEHLAAFVEVSRELSSTLDLEQVLSGIVRHARTLLGGRLSSLMLDRDGKLETVASDGAGPAYLASEPRETADSFVGRVVRSGQALAVDDVRAEPDFRLADVAEAEGLYGLLSVPIASKGRVLGVLNVYSGERRRFRRDDVTLLNLLAQQSAVAIENASLFRQVREQSEHLRESEKLAALGRLSAGFAHELRNPLNTLNVLLYAMTERSEGASTADLEVVRSEIHRMSALLDQFLDFARPRPPRFRRQPVETVLDETLTLVGAEASKHGVTLVREQDPPAPPVWADATQLKQVFLNLALNAIQAMSSAGGTLRVGLRRAGGSVVTAFRDDGPGIPAEVRERLFEPFFTTRDHGTGLGLSIALRIVEAHSGNLTLDSQPGRGTVASVWLPV